MRNQKMFDMLKSAVDKAKNGTPSKSNENYWKLEGDKAKNGSAVIRFLPGKDDNSLPFVKIYNHGFKNKAGKWFIENCPTTLEHACPVCEKNSDLWSTKVESNIEIARERKRKAKYISNILVVSDPKNPDNEGKVFLFQYGQKIFEKIFEAINPQFEDETPMNIFDPVEGANFKLKMSQVGGFANFDKSGFSPASEIGNEKEIASVISQLHDIDGLIAPDQFKSYDDLLTRFNATVGNTGRQSRSETNTDDDSDAEYVRAVVNEKIAAKPVKTVQVSDDDDDMMAEFQRLADED